MSPRFKITMFVILFLVSISLATAPDHLPANDPATDSSTTLKNPEACEIFVGKGSPQYIVIGASNSVDRNGGSFVELLDAECIRSSVEAIAAVEYTPSKQKQELLPKALQQKPDVLIIEPSGNGIGSSKAALDQFTAAVKEMAVEAKKAGVSKVVILSISARKGYDYGGDAHWTPELQQNIEAFNSHLLQSKLDLSEIDLVVDIYSVLDKGDGSCAFCTKDGGHWTSVGHTRVADQILCQFSGTVGPCLIASTASEIEGKTTAAGESFSEGGSSSTGPSSSSKNRRSIPGCTGRCFDIDEVWNKYISFLVGGFSAGKVWNTLTSQWDLFDTVHYEAQITSVQGTGVISPSALGTTGAISTSLVCIAQGGGSPEMNALLDTIAWAEGTYGNYNRVVQGSLVSDPEGRLQKVDGKNTFNGYNSHPKILIKWSSKNDCPNGCSTAAGRYQFMKKTYEELVIGGLYGMPPQFTQSFDPLEQDKAAAALIQYRGKITSQMLEQAIQSNNFVPIWDPLAKIWASLPSSEKGGKSYYGQGGKGYEQLQANFKKCLKEHQQYLVS